MAEQSRLEFLTEALQAEEKLEADRKEKEEAVRKASEAKRELEALEKKIADEKKTTVEKRRAEVDRAYEKQIRSAEKTVTKAENRREDARADRQKERIKTETAAYENANRDRKEQIRQILREKKLPFFCSSDFYLFMFCPRGLCEILKMLLVFVLMLGVIPCLLAGLLETTLQKVLCVALIWAAFIGLYAFIYSRTVAKEKETLSLVHDLADQIRKDEKEIRSITKRIRKDRDDSVYDLGEYDAEIARVGSQKSEIVLKKQQALAEFDSVTAPALEAEIDASYEKKLAEASLKAEESSRKADELEKALIDEELSVNDRYTRYIGAVNMNADSLTRMIGEEKQKPEETGEFFEELKTEETEEKQ